LLPLSKLLFLKFFGGPAGVAEFDFQRERATELENAVKADARLDEYFSAAKGWKKKNAEEQ
jgi:hypothetical protein